MHKLLVLYSGPRTPRIFRKVLRRKAPAAERIPGLKASRCNSQPTAP